MSRPATPARAAGEPVAWTPARFSGEATRLTRTAGRLLTLFLVLAAPLLARAQAPPNTAAPPPRPVVTEVRVVGDDVFPGEDVVARIRTRQNRRFLGVPGLTWWVQLYRLGASGRLGKRLSQALMASGEPPAYLDSATVRSDVEQLELFYQQEGFRQADVTARVRTRRQGTRARVFFDVDLGAPTFIRRVAYEGLDALSPAQQRQLARASVLRAERIAQEAPLQLRAQQQRYSESLLLEERRRLLLFLRNTGYAAVARDSVRALVRMARPDSFDVTFRVRPGPRYRFGDVHFDVIGPEDQAAVRIDTLAGEPGGDQVTARIQYESELRTGLLRRSLRFRPGDWFDQSQVLATKRRLDATGVFAFTEVRAGAPQPAHADTLAPRLPQRFELRTRPRHQIRVETFALQRSTADGLLADASSEIGTGLGLSYNNANLFGSGEAFGIRLAGSVSSDFESRLLTSAQADVSTTLALPYLAFPFGRLDQALGLYDARTRLSLSLLTARSEDLRLIIRGRGAARLRYELRHSPVVTSFLDVLDLTLSNPDTLTGFNAQLESLFNLERIDDPGQLVELLGYSQPQVNDAVRYTVRAATVNPLQREQGYAYEASAEVGGNLPYLLDALVFTPGALEGSLPGLPFFRDGSDGARLAYRRYVRLAADLRRYLQAGERSVLALKGVVGFAHPIAQSQVAPFDRRFFSGGATSVRGWQLRELGPGAAQFSEGTAGSDTDVNILGGDIKLEASLELRHTLVRDFLSADWAGAGFVDAGNVWFGPRNPGLASLEAFESDQPDGRFRLDGFYRELGVGSGVGLRIAWDYLVVRFDFAYRVHDPAERERSGFFPQRLRNPLVHFGIGHTF